MQVKRYVMVKLKNIFKNRNNFMNEISSRAMESNDEGERESGFLPKKGMKRELGVNKNKPEPWFEKGGYTQLNFPKSDQIYDKNDKKTPILQVITRITNIGDKYEGFQSDVGSWDKYGDKDFSTDFDFEDLLRMYK